MADESAPGGTPPPAGSRPQPLDVRLLRQPHLPPARPALAGRADSRSRSAPGCPSCGAATDRPARTATGTRLDLGSSDTRDCPACGTTSGIAWDGDAWRVVPT